MMAYYVDNSEHGLVFRYVASLLDTPSLYDRVPDEATHWLNS